MLNQKLYLVVILTLFAFTPCKTQEVQKSEADSSQLKGAHLGQIRLLTHPFSDTGGFHRVSWCNPSIPG